MPDVAPLVARKGWYEVEVEAGCSYWWCACGKSKIQPFCDGAHKGTGLGPVEYAATENKLVRFCGCKQTGNAPFCDGSHALLDE